MTDDNAHREAERLLRDLVRIETENPPGNEAACARFVADWFDERGIDHELVRRPYEDRPQVVARVGDGAPTLVLNGHMDVVPAGDHDRWDHPPYAAEVEDGAVYGRGAADMKSGLAVGMVTAARLRDALDAGDLRGSILVHAAVDEEVVGPGTRTLVEEGYVGDYGVVLEPTGLRTATAEKGHVWYEITVEGEPSHGSRPDQGVNAVAKAHRVVDALFEYDRAVRERTDDLLGSAYATVTGFDAGTKENVVPERARITLDRRFVPGETGEVIDREVDDLLSTVAADHDVDVSWDHVDIVADASKVPADCELAETLRSNAVDVAGVDPVPWGFPATTDLRNLVNDAGMEAVTWGPGELSQAHTTDEHVPLSQVRDAVDVLTRTAETLLAPDG